MERINVLYIEDDQLDRMALDRVVQTESLPFNVIYSETIEDAINVIDQEPIDVIIADYLLTDGTAFEILELQPKAPVLVVTGSGDEEIAIKAMKNGAFDYIIKDTSRNYLKMLPITINSILEQHRNQFMVKLLKSSVLNSSDMVIIMEANMDNPILSKPIFQNGAFHHQTGIDKREIEEMGISIMFGEKTSNHELERMINELNKLNNVRVELLLYDKRKNSFWADITLVPIIENEVCNHIVLIARNITEKKKNEEELIIAKQIAESAKKAEEYFLAMMSHEIRTPINSVVGLVDLMFDTSISKEQNEYLSSIRSSADGLLRLLSNILDMSRLAQGNLKVHNAEFNLEEVIKDSVKTLRFAAADKNTELQIVHDLELPRFVHGDSMRFGQIIINLINNAVKFTENGVITIKSKVLEVSDRKTTIEFRIIDTGVGISKKKLERIFEKYKQADEDTMIKYGGSGLGLYIVQEMVKFLDGKVRVESEINKGSVFIVTLDFGRVKPAVSNNPFTEQRSLRHRKILIGEDNRMNKMIIEKMMDKWEAIPTIVSNGKLVIEELKQNDSYDVLLIDLQMPIMGGDEAIKYIRNVLHSDIQIILMTASVFREKFEDVMPYINKLLQKPFSSTTLYEQICTCIQNISTESKPVHNSFNLEFLRIASNNNEVFVNEMIQIFNKQVDKFNEQFPQLLQQKEFQEISFHSHTIKSSSRNIGNKQLYRLCEKIEEISSTDNVSVEILGNLLNQFKEESTLTKKLLKESQKLIAE